MQVDNRMKGAIAALLPLLLLGVVACGGNRRALRGHTGVVAGAFQGRGMDE